LANEHQQSEKGQITMPANWIEVTEAPYFFGLSTNTPAQNRTAGQQAIDDAIAAFKTDKIPRTLTFFGMTGRVDIDGPLIVADFNGTGYASSVTVHFKGPGCYNADLGANIRQIDGALPCLIFQRTRSCKVEGLNLSGLITAAPTHDKLFHDEDVETAWWRQGGAISNRPYAPHAGIVMDPFSTGIASGDQYPGLSDRYVASSGSNSLYIDNCAFTGFDVCVGWSLSFTNQGDGCVLSNSRFFRSRTCLAIGRDQARMCSLVDPFVNFCTTLVDCRSYGNGIGQMPEIRGGQVTIAKQAFIGSGQRYSGSIVGLATESIYRLGSWQSGSTLTLVGCQIKTINPIEGSGYAPDTWLYAEGSVAFFGGRIWINNDLRNVLNIFANSKVSFFGVSLDDEFAYANRGTPQGSHVVYENCTVINSTQGESFGLSMKTLGKASGAASRRLYMPVGAKLIENGANESVEYVEWTSQGNPALVLDAAATLTTGAAGTASFVSTNPAAYIVGEFVHTSTSFQMSPFVNGETLPMTGAAGHLAIGEVFSVVGSTVTLRCVPKAIVSGVYNVTLARSGFFRPRMMATLTNGSTSATLSAASIYSVGDRIRGQGIPAGAWITAVSGASITLSHAATASDTVEVYDARIAVTGMRSFANGNPGGTWFKGDRFEIFGFDVSAAARSDGQKAIRCVKSGTSAVWIREYDGVPSSSSGSVTYAPAIGDVGSRKRMTSASAIAFSWPSDSTLDVPIGGWIEVEAAGTGTITHAAAAGATLQSRGSLVASNGRYSVQRGTKVAANTWTLSGDLA
jgi:hypothetical protein